MELKFIVEMLETLGKIIVLNSSPYNFTTNEVAH